MNPEIQQNDRQVESLNEPNVSLTIDCDGVEELEERVEMTICGGDCCSYRSYGRC